MSPHERHCPPAYTIGDLELLQGLLAQRLYVNESDRRLLRALLAEAPRAVRPNHGVARGRLRAGGAALVFGGALALTLGGPLLPASAASPAPAAAIVAADRAADKLAAPADDALLRALLNSATTTQTAAMDAGRAALRAGDALAQAELSAGQTLVIPATHMAAAAAAAAPPAAAEQQSTRSYVVQPGDTLSGIAQNFYGNGDLWPAIFYANTDKIADPHWIYPNQQLLIPAAASSSGQTVPAQPQTGRGIGQYTVQPGDTLSGIAAYAYGNGDAWWGIYQANAGSIANPDLIYPGQVLRIP